MKTKTHKGIKYNIVSEWLLADTYYNNFGVFCYRTDNDKVIIIPSKMNRNITDKADIISSRMYEEYLSNDCGKSDIDRILSAIRFLLNDMPFNGDDQY